MWSTDHYLKQKTILVCSTKRSTRTPVHFCLRTILCLRAIKSVIYAAQNFLETVGWAGTSFDFLAGLQLLRFLTVDKRPLNNGCGVPGIPTSLQNILQPRGVGWCGCVADNNYKRWRIVDPLILLEARAEPEATIWNYSLHVDWSIESSVSLHKECRATPTFVHLWLKYFQGESICSWSISQVDQGRSQCRVASIYW